MSDLDNVLMDLPQYKDFQFPIFYVLNSKSNKITRIQIIYIKWITNTMQLTHGRKDRHVSPRRYLSLIWFFFFTKEKVSPVKKEIPSLSCADLEGKGAGFYPQGNSNYSNFYRKITENMPRTGPPPRGGGGKLKYPSTPPPEFF